MKLSTQTHCAYCDAPFDPMIPGRHRTKDHIVPRSLRPPQRGSIIGACASCNWLKGDMLPDAMRVMAEEFRKRAALLDQIADRTEALIAERGLLP